MGTSRESELSRRRCAEMLMMVGRLARAQTTLALLTRSVHHMPGIIGTDVSTAKHSRKVWLSTSRGLETARNNLRVTSKNIINIFQEFQPI